MRPGQHLERLDLGSVGSHEAVAVAVGAHHVGEHLGVAGVGLGAARRMAVSIARRRHRVHRVELVAGGHQGADEKAPVRLDADHHFLGILDVSFDELVKAGDALHPFGQAGLGKSSALLVAHMHVVVGLSPIHSHKDHLLATFRSSDQLL